MNYHKNPYKTRKEKAICPVCGKEFIKQAFNQKYCSEECKRIDWKMKAKKKYREKQEGKWWRKYNVKVDSS